MMAPHYPGAVLQALGVVMSTILATGCGVPPDPAAPGDDVPELTFVSLEQFNTPELASQADEPTLYRVTVDVTLVFRFADGLETLIVEIGGPTSGRLIHHEFDLKTLVPGIEAVRQGRQVVRVPLTIPEFGALSFRVIVMDQLANSSGPVEGSFTVHSEVGASDTTQTQTTQVGIITEFQGR